MSQMSQGSHDSLSPEECDRLVLSPPPSGFNPVKLREFISCNRTTSHQHSLNIVNPEAGMLIMPRHASVAWSRSEYDSKFKQYENQIKSAVTSDALPEVHLHEKAKDPSQSSEPISASPSPVSICTEVSETSTVSPNKLQTPVSLKSKKIESTHDWRRFLCCVPSRSRLPDQSTLRPVLSDSGSVPAFNAKAASSEVPVTSNATPTKITKSSKWPSVFRKSKNLTGANKKATVKLQSVKKPPQMSDERLKSPAPKLLVTLHETNSIVSGTSCTGINTIVSSNDQPHCEENGVVGYHVNSEDLAHVQNGLQQGEDSCQDSLVQVNPGENLLGQPPPDCVGKKCLVLDLDETLVHSSFKPVKNADFTVIVEIDNIQHEVSVCKRPHLETFIETIGPLFEVVMFTASLSMYADPVCDRIDPAGHFKHRLFRESCFCFKSNYIKHLGVLGRDIEQICIIDNSPISFYFHRQNALQIVTWLDDPTDTALLDLIPYLKGLAAAPSALEYVSQYAPPPTAAIAQPELPPWLFAPAGPGGCGWDAYNDEEEEEEELEGGDGSEGEASDDPQHTHSRIIHNAQEISQRPALSQQGPTTNSSSSTHNIIAMASRPSGEVITAT